MLHALPDMNRQLQVKKFFGIGLRNVRWKTGEINFKWKTVKTFFFLLLISRSWHLSSGVTPGHFFQVGGTLHAKFQQ